MVVLNQEGRATRKGATLLTEDFQGPSGYSGGGNIFTSSVLSKLERVTALGPGTSGHLYVVVTGSVTGNQFKVQALRVTGVSADGVAGEIDGGTDLSGEFFRVLEEGV